MDRIELSEPQEFDEADWYSNEAATFGDRVAAGREALGLSQAELAHRLGIKTKTLQSWEDDLSEPRANRLQMLSGVLNVSLMWLLNGEGEGVSAPNAASAGTGDTEALLAEFRELQVTLAQTSKRLGALEKRLRKSLVSRSA